MFSTTKTIACLEFSKISVFCALAQITGRKVDILAIDEINIETGILEEGIVYDIPHLKQIVKNLITSVSKNQSKIDCAWIAIPDNKVKIASFDVIKEKKGVSDYELHRIIEEKFSYNASKLYLINRPIHDINQHVFYLTNGIRVEHLDPFLSLLEPLQIPVEAVFPTFQCLFEELKDQFTVPTLLLYPYGKGYKFFLADSNGVYLDSVWGHNVIEFNENLDKAIEEIISFAKQSKDIAMGVKKVMAVESSKHDSELLQIYLRRTGLEFAWVPIEGNTGSNVDQVSLIILKGLIKNAMNTQFNKGFLEPQTTHNEELTPDLISRIKTNATSIKEEKTRSPMSFVATPTRQTQYKNANMLEERWNIKVITVSVLLGIVLIGSIAYAGWRIADRVAKNAETSTARTTPTPTSSIPTATSTPTTTTTYTPTTAPTVTATQLPALKKSDVRVLVQNGNNKAGEAKLISGILQSKGFITKAPENAPSRDIPTTTISYKDPRSKELADEIAKLVESRYPSAKSQLDQTITEDILVVLGAR